MCPKPSEKFISKALGSYCCPVFNQMIEIDPFTFYVYADYGGIIAGVEECRGLSPGPGESLHLQEF